MICRLGSAIAAGFVGLAAMTTSWPAAAHPHVWVTTREVLVFDGDGRLSALRHEWTFDEGYSAYAVQGLKTGPDGNPTPEELTALAKLNVGSLTESDYFTFGKANGAKLTFSAASDYSAVFDGKALTLRFVLPLKEPVPKLRYTTVGVYDPTFFVDFAMAPDAKAAELEAAPVGCALRVDRPKLPAPAVAGNAGESFFAALSASSDYGAQLSARIVVSCP